MLYHVGFGRQVEQIRAFFCKVRSDLPMEAKHSAASVFEVIGHCSRESNFLAVRGQQVL